MSKISKDQEIKRQFVRSFFEGFGRKVERLPELFAQSFCDEAFTLCVVYIDRLASGHYGGDRKNHENFSRALRELAGNPLFAMLHPRELLENAETAFPDALPFLEALVKKHPDALLEEHALAQAIANSTLDESTKQSLTANLWRASIASICYSDIRAPEIHGRGSGGLSFDESVHVDRKGIRADFPLVYEALRSIFEQIKAKSIQNADWFGNPNYPNRNSAT